MCLEKFIATDNSDENVNNHLRILTVYLETTIEFTDSEKQQLLEKLGLAKLIEENKFENTNLLTELMEKDKLVYNKDIFSALYNQNRNVALDYALKFENKNNLNEFFNDTDWSFTLNYLSNTILPENLVALFDEYAEKNNTKCTKSDISQKNFEMISKYTESITVLKSLMEISTTLDRKAIVLEKLFKKDKFKHQFTKSEISTFLCGDKDFIGSWRINGRSVITSDTELLNNYSSELSLLYDKLPVTFKKKGTKKKIILRKQFDDWFKKEND